MTSSADSLRRTGDRAATDSIIDAWLRPIAFAFAVAVAMIMALSGSSADEQLRIWRDAIQNRSATGTIAIIEIDAQSVDRIAAWPWPRRVHARLVDQLRELGASPVAFDVDFSSSSTAADDATLAAALRRSGGTVILPTFRQRASTQSTLETENLPIPALRSNAFLGSVNVQPDADGHLRRYSYGTETAGTPRPSIAALLAGSHAKIGTSFRVDTAIDPATIPRFSVIDVLDGRVPAGALRGKAVLIGATAIEMGDRYVVPGRGIQPGVVVQVVAAETLLQGTTNPDFGPAVPILLAIAAIAICINARRRRWYPFVVTGVAVVLVMLPFVLEMWKIGSVQVVPALVLIALDAAARGALRMRRKFAESRLIDLATGLPNARALERHCKPHAVVTIVKASVRQFEEIDAVLNSEDRAALIAQFTNRLSIGFPDAVMHAAGPGALAWMINGRAGADLYDQIDGVAALFRAPIALGQRTILATPNFGISAGAGADVRLVLAQATYAVRQAQREGVRLTVHSDGVTSATDRSLRLLGDVDTALNDGGIHVVYQPKWCVAKTGVSGAEALVRWNHPDLGPVGPDEFIPLLEANGMMAPLTLRVLEICLDQLSDWRAKRLDLSVAINISAGLLNDAVFIETLLNRLSNARDLTPWVTLEVTESAAISSTKLAIGALDRLRALGVRISIDDYGTGHATLAYLKSFPTDEIKIDKSFVTNLATSKGDQIVVRSTIDLAHELGFSVVAEGAEDAAALDILLSYGCDFIQGWAIGRPMAPEQLVSQLHHNPMPQRLAG